MKLITNKITFIFIFIIMFISNISSLQDDAGTSIDFIYTTPINYSEIIINATSNLSLNSERWDGNLWSDTRWRLWDNHTFNGGLSLAGDLQICDSSGNYDIGIGNYIPSTSRAGALRGFGNAMNLISTGVSMTGGIVLDARYGIINLKTGSAGSATSALYIDTNQQVGIGTTSPASLLDVRGGQINILDAGSNYNMALNGVASATGGRAISIRGSSNQYQFIADGVLMTNGLRFDSKRGQIEFNTGSTGTSYNRMYIEDNGLVGINTSTPQNTLNVIGDGNFSGFLFVNNTDRVCSENNGLCGAGGIANSTAWNRSDPYVYLANTSNYVGIGTTNPQNALNVLGDGNFTEDIFGGGNLELKDGNNNEWNVNFVDVPEVGIVPIIGGASLGGTLNLTGIHNGLFIRSNSSIGVGLEGDTYLYFINGDSTKTITFDTNFSNNSAKWGGQIDYMVHDYNMNLANNNINGINNLSATGIYQNGEQVCTASNGLCGGGVANSTAWNRTGTNVHLANNSDNVGIGTSTPSAKLDIAGDMALTSASTETAYHTGIQRVGAESIFWYGGGTSSLQFKTGATGSGGDRITFDSAGRIGIGKTNPASLLDIEQGQINLLDSSSNYRFSLGGIAPTSGGRSMYIRGSSNKMEIVSAGSLMTSGIHIDSKYDGIYFKTGTAGTSTNRMTIGSSGNITIFDNLNMSNNNITEVNTLFVTNITTRSPLNIISGDNGKIIASFNQTVPIFGVPGTTFTEPFMINDNFNGTSRAAHRNKNSGESAAAAFSVYNDKEDGYITIGIASSNFKVSNPLFVPNGTTIFSHSQAVMTNGQGFFEGFRWLNNPSDDGNFLNMNNSLMNLTKEGDLQVKGNITGSRYYGEVYSADNAVATSISIAGNWYNVTELECGLQNGINCGGSNLTIQHDGIYEVKYNVGFEDGNLNTYKFSIGINGINQTKCQMVRKLGANDQGSAGSTCILDLSENDVLTLLVQNEGGTSDPTIVDSNLNIINIGD